MRKFPILPLLIISLIFGKEGHTQYFSTGQDPAATAWQQIKQKHYQIIFPEGNEQRAQYLANILDLVVKHETISLPAKVPRIPFILHSASASSNGITVWAPKRIELYPNPPSQSYAEEWLEQLAIHEYRHAVQISSMNQGFTKVLSYFFGEQIVGGVLGLYLPSWFLEGDATVTETAMSRTGRGRSALFGSVLRAQVVEKGSYSYDKATLGSYKTFTPDAYELGYFLVGQAREEYGPMVWNEAIRRSARLPFMVVPFSSGIRKTTGLWKSGLYRQVISTLDSNWKVEHVENPGTDYHLVTQRDPGTHTHYYNPQWTDDQHIVAEKTSIDDVTRFVRINRATGDECVLHTPGPRPERAISTSASLLVWAEFRRDRRWENRSYSEIWSLDLNSGKANLLTEKSRYFSPAINVVGSKIVVVERTESGDCSLVILEAKDGKVISEIPLPPGYTAMNPNWYTDSGNILLTLQCHLGQTLASADPVTGTIRELIPWSYREISGKAYGKDQFILFSTAGRGRENIFALDTISHQIFQVTDSRFAATGLSFSSQNGNILFTDYTSDGAMVVAEQFNPSQWERVTPEEPENSLADALTRQENANLQDTILARSLHRLLENHPNDSLPPLATLYPVSRYSKAGHLFNPHSWAPVSFNTGNLDFNPGVMVISQNVLNSMFATAGWEYNLNEEAGRIYAGLSYQGWYPVIDFEADYGNRSNYYNNHGTRYTWRETNLKLRASIPHNFSKGRYYRYLEPRAGISLIGVRHNEDTPGNFMSGTTLSFDYRLYATQYQRMSQKDLIPRFGQTLEVNFRHSPAGGNDMGSILAASGRFYLPGIIRHQGISIYAGYQNYLRTSSVNYSYGNLIRTPRGYTGVSDQRSLSIQFNYALPLWYPDLSAGPVIYFKRLKMNLFTDYWYGSEPGFYRNLLSAGGEITVDFHLLRFLAPVELGVRGLVYPLDRDWGWELLYAISIP